MFSTATETIGRFSMGYLFKPTITRYLGPDGRQCRTGAPGARPRAVEARKWYGAYKVDGVEKRVALSANKQAARKMLADLETAAARGEAGLVDVTAEQRSLPIGDHLEAFLDHKRTAAPTPFYLRGSSARSRPSSTTRGCARWTT
jgi:hypothetical protein